MSQYHYSSLSLEPDRIRLLRLMPHENESTERTEIQCELFEYTLQDPGKGTHLYEALSYTWGGSDKPRSISIKKQNLAVTENLHAALLRLRDRSLERILWTDAICINQEDPEEQGQQVQLMAKIYSKATRVLIWLGETAGDIEGALEDIRLAANEESIERLKKEINQQAILNLLQRPWFRRIWVREQTLNYNY
jgi:Heterokaryon incompatibility protein (HET)